jgi:hypothetical protein
MMKNTRRQNRTLIAATLFLDISPVIDTFDPPNAAKILNGEAVSPPMLQHFHPKRLEARK